MNGTTCPGHAVLVPAGQLLLQLRNNGDHVDDQRLRRPGSWAAQPNAVPAGRTPVGPVTVAAKNPPAPRSGSDHAGLLEHRQRGGRSARRRPRYRRTATDHVQHIEPERWITTGATRSRRRSPAVRRHSRSAPGSSTARLRHAPTQIGPLQLLVRNSADTTTLCTVNVPPSATLGHVTDVTIPCRRRAGSTPRAEHGTYTLRYQVQHSAAAAAAIAAVRGHHVVARRHRAAGVVHAPGTAVVGPDRLRDRHRHEPDGARRVHPRR